MRGLPIQYQPMPYTESGLVYVHLFCAGLTTAAAALVTVVHPDLWSILGLVLCGFSLALAESERHRRQESESRARVEPFLARLRRGDVDGYGWLLRVLADLDGCTPGARRRSLSALEAITADEQLMNGLIAHCRRRQISVAVFAKRLRKRGAAGLAPALASLHPDGRVREAAVLAMRRRVRPADLPFLVERAVDWAPQVRSAAHRVLRSQLRERPELVPPARLAFARVARRKHAPALAQLIDGA